VGTNYYWRFKICTCCGRYNEAHVAKSGNTWQAYPQELLNADHSDWGFATESPLGFPVLSFADWRKVFIEVPGELWDEYGQQINDPVAWLDEWQPPDVEARRRKLEYWHEGTNWWCPDGYHFVAQDFS
jgi:hypothetical protein